MAVVASNCGKNATIAARKCIRKYPALTHGNWLGSDKKHIVAYATAANELHGQRGWQRRIIYLDVSSCHSNEMETRETGKLCYEVVRINGHRNCICVPLLFAPSFATNVIRSWIGRYFRMAVAINEQFRAHRSASKTCNTQNPLQHPIYKCAM